VDYVQGEIDSKCYDGTAPTILASGKGQCDTQSIVLISLLRKMGIAAKPVGGCIVPNPECRIQTIFFGALQGAGQAPKFTGLDGVDSAKTEFSRGDEKSRTGGLHAWVVAWIPDEGWVTLEATSGKIANIRCYYYHVELYPEDGNKDDICVSKSWHYSMACANNNLDLLDQYGLGITGEVTPQ